MTTTTMTTRFLKAIHADPAGAKDTMLAHPDDIAQLKLEQGPSLVYRVRDDDVTTDPVFSGVLLKPDESAARLA